MKAVRIIHSALSEMDLFATQQFLRYKGEAEYKTATGGCCSITVIIIFIILFINTGLNVINKATVNVTYDVSHSIDPPETVLKASPEGKFMISVNIAETGISDANYTYFDVSLQQSLRTNPYNPAIATEIPLEFCTSSHYNFDEEIAKQYNQYRVNTFLCPALDHEVKFSGNLLSNNNQFLTLLIKKCDTSKHTNCAPDSLIQSVLAVNGFLTAVVSVITTQINPSHTNDYLGYYIEARNLFAFTMTLAVRAKAYMEDYEIDTDTSLLPFEKKEVETGSYISELFQHSNLPVIANTYFMLTIEKSPNSITYTRSFQKIDDFLSYVGGLVGLVLSLIFIIGKYSELSFEISLGSHLFTYERDVSIDSSSFNFLTYLSYLVFKLCRCLGCCKRFQMMEVIQLTHDEIEKQIDIENLLQRISTLERGMVSLVGQADFELLHFVEKPTLEEAKAVRQKSQLYAKYRKKDLQMEGMDQTQNDALFSEQPSYSSIRSHKYRSLKKQFQMLMGGEAKSKCINQQFLERLQENKARQKGEKGTEIGRAGQQSKVIGEDYFKSIETSRIKGANNAGWAQGKRNQDDEL